jgi:uncharacterized protein YggT (Ycf19 family)
MKCSSRGHAATEYLLILALVVLVLWSGSDDAIGQLLAAIRNRYLNFIHVLSQP